MIRTMRQQQQQQQSNKSEHNKLKRVVLVAAALNVAADADDPFPFWTHQHKQTFQVPVQKELV